MRWPGNKKFAFTIVDDTDNATLANIKPVYNLLSELNFKTTKTAWIFPSRDRFTGSTIQDQEYKNFLKDLQGKGFEIALHGVGSGDFKREEIQEGLKQFKETFRSFPNMHINHAQNSHNLFWGKRSGSRILQWYKRLRIPEENFYGDCEGSDFFWGDLSKQYIKYIRSRTCSKINTLKFDPKMPYRDRDKEDASNFWFSSSDGADVKKLNQLIKKENIDELENEGGLCIVYTHFASGFVDEQGKLNQEFKEKLTYLSRKDGWFAPASEILDFLLKQKKREYEKESYFLSLDLKLMMANIKRKIF